MDIAGLSMAMSTGRLQGEVSTSVLKKTMDTNEALGDRLVQMIDASAVERSVNPSVGSNFDIRV